ncbi:hypothetical protein [uncultured Pseudacidovorax sp.]|nr:hypothetical protein [uncultured Pseudacidovorax sp.]
MALVAHDQVGVAQACGIGPFLVKAEQLGWTKRELHAFTAS